jgi:hypothetical protein
MIAASDARVPPSAERPLLRQLGLRTHKSNLCCAGHRPHDQRFAEILQDETHLNVVLWPEHACTAAEVRDISRQQGKGIRVIAVDATWNGARNLLRSYEGRVTRMRLSESPMQTASSIAPLRKYAASLPRHEDRCVYSRHIGGGQRMIQDADAIPDVFMLSLCLPADDSHLANVICQRKAAASHRCFCICRVCTLDAVAAALSELGEDQAVNAALGANMQLKVNAVLRQKCK